MPSSDEIIRGHECRILPVSADDEDKTYFLIRHGMPFKREGKMETGESKTIFYRPEFHIDHKKLATKIAEAIGFTEQHEQIAGHNALWQFGVLNPQAEHGFPVYCFLGQRSSQLDKIINQLCMNDQAFLLIASTSSLISTASSDASCRHKSKLIGIDDVLPFGGRENLRTLFGHDDEPIPYNKSVYECQPILKIRQDTNCDLNDRISDIHQQVNDRHRLVRTGQLPNA